MENRIPHSSILPRGCLINASQPFIRYGAYISRGQNGGNSRIIHLPGNYRRSSGCFLFGACNAFTEVDYCMIGLVGCTKNQELFIAKEEKRCTKERENESGY